MPIVRVGSYSPEKMMMDANFNNIEPPHASSSVVKVNLYPNHQQEKRPRNAGLVPALCVLVIAFTTVAVVFLVPDLFFRDRQRTRATFEDLQSGSSDARLGKVLPKLEDESLSPDISTNDHPTAIGDAIVQTKNGALRGMVYSILGRTVHAYLGIPYAKPPVGQLRFHRPEPVANWRGLYPALDFSEPCVQYIPGQIQTPWVSKRSNGSEDCLYLNIWTPKEKGPLSAATELKTVMVWLHGGAFFSGSADVDLYHGEYLSSFGDVVLVSLNYRLGALGFLNAATDQVGGNMGLFDQLMALHWIKDNIVAFGGDPESIVLFGQSAGATSAGLHLFSPLSKTIAKRVILQSGGPLFPKNYYDNSLDKSNEFAIEVGCAIYNSSDLFNAPDEVLSCLKSKSVSELVAAHEPLFQRYKIPFFPRPGDDFLPELPHEAILDPDTLGPQQEILMGSVADEGSFFLHLFFPQFFTNDRVNETLSVDSAKAFVAEAYSFIPERQAKMMSQFFLGGLSEASSKEDILKTTHNVIGDSGFVCPAVHMSETLSEYNVSVYHYFFTHRPSTTKWGSWLGSTHLDEVDFIFGGPLRHPNKYTKDEVAFSERMINTWTQFAKTGTVPPQLGVEWPQYTIDEPLYMELNATEADLGNGPHASACGLWKIVFDSFL